eukprot:234377-Ditylum_brightwellii.AAC.1
MKQIAFESGLIDLEKLKFYFKGGPKDEDDFVEEENLLQHMSKKIGSNLRLRAIVDRTSKCNPELSGEGIEYTWVNIKIFLRSISLEKRKNKKNVHNTVRLALATNEGAFLSKCKIRKFSACAHDFIAAYHILHSNGSSSTSLQASVNSLSKRDIERTRKRHRSHQGVEQHGTAWCAS